jgi:hypothetical protein
VTCIKVNRLRWTGLDEQSPTIRILVAVLEGKNQRGITKQIWEYGVMGDARELGEKSRTNAARYKDGWQKLLKKPWAQTGLMCE